jgi:hypothetical protein
MLSDQIKNLIEWRIRIVTVVALTLSISRVVERTRTDVRVADTNPGALHV